MSKTKGGREGERRKVDTVDNLIINKGDDKNQELRREKDL
jgi:hypothetical protein